MKYHTLFFQKLGKMSQNLSSVAVVIGTLRVKEKHVCQCFIFTVYLRPFRIDFLQILIYNSLGLQMLGIFCQINRVLALD